jgi:6-phosphogluconate dehydrogenase
LHNAPEKASIQDLSRAYRDNDSTCKVTNYDLTAMALAKDPALSKFTAQDSGEGRWTIQSAIEESISAEVLTVTLFARFRSRQEHTFAEKMLSDMRNNFGGHAAIYPGN